MHKKKDSQVLKSANEGDLEANETAVFGVIGFDSMNFEGSKF